MTDALQAGRELDALVAEKVFGMSTAWLGLVRSGADICPAYSTDVASAWLVVEKMRLSLVCSEDGWYAILPTDIRWGCVRGTDFEEVALVGEEQKRWQAYPTAPLAICKAALSAMESNQGAR